MASPDVATTLETGGGRSFARSSSPRGTVASVSPFDSGSDRNAASASSSIPALHEVTGDHLRAGFAAAASWLELKSASVNALNVFPVPDGDTGTNMSMTMRAAVEAAAVELAPEASAVARAAARGAL